MRREIKKAISIILAAVFTSAMVLTGLSPTGVLAADVNAVAGEVQETAVAETETEAPAAAEADVLDAVAEVGEKKVEIGMPGVTFVEDGSPKVYMNYFPTDGLDKGTELPDFKEAVADDPNNTIYFQEVTAAEAADGTGSLLAVNWQWDGEELDGLRYPKYVQFTQNAKAGTSGLGNNNEPMPIDSEWKVPTQGALVIHPKYGADGKPMDASLKIVGAQGSANRGMSVLKVADDAEDKGKTAGTARISCVYDPYGTGGFTYTTTAYVEDPKLSSAPGDSLEIRNAAATKGQLKLGVDDKYLIKVGGVYQPVTFESSKNNIAFVDEAGVVCARAKGKAVLSARVNGKKLTVNVTVE